MVRPRGFAGADSYPRGFSRDRIIGQPSPFNYSYTGVLAVSTGTHRIYNDTGRTLTIETVRASVGGGAPTGASVKVDVNKDGTTIFTTQANRPTIAISDTTATGIPDVTAFANGSYLTVDIDQIGSTLPGTDLTVTVMVH